MKNLEKEIEIINEIIKEAVYHGGDSGGAYFGNEDSLYEAIFEWLKFKKIHKDYYISKNEYRMPYITKRNLETE